MLAHRSPSPATALVAAVCVCTLAARAQPAQTGNAWSGEMRCDVVLSAPGYSNRLTHTWTIAGAPSLVGAIAEHPATWTVSGEGTLRSTNGNGQTVSAEWKTQGVSTGARIGIFVRASDGRLLALPRHSQLSARATTGTAQTLDGNGKPSTRRIDSVVSELSPWPRVEDSAQSARLSGSESMPFTARLDALQPRDFKGTTTCTWDFVRTAGGLQSFTGGGQTTQMPTQSATASASSASTASTTSLAVGAASALRDSHRPLGSNQSAADGGAIPVDAGGGIAAGGTCQSLLAQVSQAYASLQNAIDVEYSKLGQDLAARTQELETKLNASLVASAARARGATTPFQNELQDEIKQIETQRTRLAAIAQSAATSIAQSRTQVIDTASTQCSGTITTALAAAVIASLQAVASTVSDDLTALADAVGSNQTATPQGR